MKHTLSFLGLVIVAATLRAEVSPVGIFSDHAVLQQGVPIPVWGRAKEGERVSVSFDGQTETTVAKDGKWMVRLKAHAAGGPFVMTIAGENSITVKDVLVGEVWVCSGQSNMAWSLKQAGNAATETPTANYPKFRMFTVTQKTALYPQTELTGKWIECSPATVGNFSAVGYFFGRNIHKATGAPVGMIHSSWGGTPAESWTSLSGLEKDPELHSHVETVKSLMANYNVAAAKYPQEMADYQAKLKEWNEKVGWPLKKATRHGQKKTKKTKLRATLCSLDPLPPSPDLFHRLYWMVEITVPPRSTTP